MISFIIYIGTVQCILRLCGFYIFDFFVLLALHRKVVRIVVYNRAKMPKNKKMEKSA